MLTRPGCFESSGTSAELAQSLIPFSQLVREAVEHLVHLVHPVATKPDPEVHGVDVVGRNRPVDRQPRAGAVVARLPELAATPASNDRDRPEDGESQQNEQRGHRLIVPCDGEPCRDARVPRPGRIAERRNLTGACGFFAKTR